MRAWCITDGNLWLVDGDKGVEKIESPFAQEIVARAERDRRVDAWKHAPRENYQGMIPANMLWGGRGCNTPSPPPRFRHAVRGRDADSLYYLLELSGSSGLFHYNLRERREYRVFHNANFRCLGMAYDADSDRIVMAAQNADGTANLAVYDAKGNAKGNITGGDAVDAAPSLSMREKGVVWFQSAGVARHPQQGYVMAVGPAAINRLRYGSGELHTVLQDPAYDFLSPREDRNGNLFYIRRPYEKSATQQAGSFLKDVLFLPWRLLKAIFGYLNFFSAIYGREPLRSSGGPNDMRMEQDVLALWLHGRMIDLNRVTPESQKTGLVPASWQLRRRSPDGQDAVVAEHVVSFDLADDGSVYYTNGYEVSHIFQRTPVTRRQEGLVEAVGAV